MITTLQLLFLFLHNFRREICFGTLFWDKTAFKWSFLNLHLWDNRVARLLHVWQRTINKFPFRRWKLFKICFCRPWCQNVPVVRLFWHSAFFLLNKNPIRAAFHPVCRRFDAFLVILGLKPARSRHRLAVVHQTRYWFTTAARLWILVEKLARHDIPASSLNRRPANWDL